MILTAEDKPTKSIRVDHRTASWAPELPLPSPSNRRPAQPPVCGGRFARTSSGGGLSPFLARRNLLGVPASRGTGHIAHAPDRRPNDPTDYGEHRHCQSH